MRAIDDDLVRKLVLEFAHGVGIGFDPGTSQGCQRESLRSLGFGWLYFALAQVIEPRRILIVGSGRGFSVACFALGIERNPDAQLVFVDPGYEAWSVEDTADNATGFWKDAATTASYFASSLGLHNVRHLPLRSDEALAQLRREGERFDLVLIDGEHSYKQALADFRSAWDLLSKNGLLLAHDARCGDWPGVALAIAHLETERAEAQVFTLPLYPGLGLIQRRAPLLIIRRATVEENERINHWRQDSGVTMRPLDDPGDPRAGVDYENPRIGLFSILEDDELIGGFGMKYRTFTEAGADNFQPDDRGPLSGFLCYGIVIRAEKRGRGRWQLVVAELLRRCGVAGYFNITAHQISVDGMPWQHRKVGQTPTHVAYHTTLRRRIGSAAHGATELQIENTALRGEIDELRAELERNAKLVERLESKNIRLTQLLKENIQLFQENAHLSQEGLHVSQQNFHLAQRNLLLTQQNAHLSQDLSGARLLNEKMRRSWVWLPLKPFRWLEHTIRRHRKKIQAKYFPGKRVDEEIGTPSLVQGSEIPLCADSVKDREECGEPSERDKNEAPKRAVMDMAPLPYQPLISILMPVCNTPERLLRRAIESVLNQYYGIWELCIADDASTMPHVKKVLTDYEKSDSRIKVVFREQNGHISEASNSALEMARGEFSALLDHDDELTPDALSSVIVEICGHPDANLIYSDYDEIDQDGMRCSAYFKPDWNPDLLLSQNIICHLAVYRTDLLRTIGGFRKGFEGSQDWDLSLRVTETCRAEQIRHIPKILYHWRRHEQSASYNLDSSHYAVVAAKKALTEHLERKKRKGKVIRTRFMGWFRVRYEIENPPHVSIIICTRDRIDLLRPCIESVLEKTSYKNYDILVVDNNSREQSTHEFLDECRNNPRLRVIKDEGEFNFSALNNRAASQASGDVLCFLNNDTVVISSEWLEEMVSHAMREEIGAVGAKLLFPDGRIQHAGIVLGMGGIAGHVFAGLPGDSDGYMGRAQLIQNYTAITGACMVMRKSVFVEVGGFNETELKISFNDIDLCLRIHSAGYRNLWTPYALLYHHQSASRGQDVTPSQQELAATEADYFHNRWRELIYHDPGYNPSLSLVKADCGQTVSLGIRKMDVMKP